MSSMLSSGGGSRAYTTLNLDIIKSPASTSWISNSSSPSSTLSESSNSPLTISTRKPRTPRKRPNQIYNEAAAILSTAHPKIFPKNKFTKKSYGNGNSSNKNPFFFEPSSELLIPFQVIHSSGFLLNDSPPILERRPTCCLIESKGFLEKPCLSPGEITSEICDGYEEDFDAESILDDEEIEVGSIDSIMGNSTSLEKESIDNSRSNYSRINSACTYGYPVVSHGLRNELRAIRRDVDEGDWWRFPCVNVVDITPKIEKMSMEKKKKKKKIEIKNLEKTKSSTDDDSSIPPQKNVGLLLKLNYNSVLNEWSDKDSPFSGDAPGGECAGNDVHARLAQIDLFSENDGMRGASVLRYKEKRRTRLYSKKIRYQVRKVNADRRPRMKGRFVRSPNSTDNEQGL